MVQMYEGATLAKVADEFAGMFERKTRAGPDGESFDCLKDGAPDWVSEIVHEAHGEMLPDDWRYRMIRAAADGIDERLSFDPDEDMQERARDEIIDGFVPVYNVERVAWLASHLGRAGWCDDAAEDGLVAADAGIFDRIGIGIYQEMAFVYDAVLKGLTDRAEEIEAEAD